MEQEAIQIQVIYSEFIAKCCNSKKKKYEMNIIIFMMNAFLLLFGLMSIFIIFVHIILENCIKILISHLDDGNAVRRPIVILLRAER